MFSFPNKERRLDWIRSAVAQRSVSGVNTDTDLPLYHTNNSSSTDHPTGNENGDPGDLRHQRNRLASAGSLLLVDDPLTWQPHGGDNKRDESLVTTERDEDSEIPSQEIRHESSEASGYSARQFGQRYNYGSANERFVMGGVMLGGVALTADDTREEREIVWDSLEEDPLEEILGAEGSTPGIMNHEENNVKKGRIVEDDNGEMVSSVTVEEDVSGTKSNENKEFSEGEIACGESSTASIITDDVNVATVQAKNNGTIPGCITGIAEGGIKKGVSRDDGNRGIDLSSKNVADRKGSVGKFRKRGGEGGRWEAQRGAGFLDLTNGEPKGGGNEKESHERKESIGDGNEQLNGCNGNNEVTVKKTDAADHASLHRGEVSLLDDLAVDANEVQDVDEVEANEAGNGDGENADIIDAGENEVAGGEDEAFTERPSTYLRDYHSWMYRFGISAFVPGDDGQLLNWCDKFLYVAQKLLCVIILGSSVFRSLCQSKRWSLYFLVVDGKSKYSDFVQMSYNASFLIISLFAAYLFVMAKDKFEKMLQSMEEYEDTYYSGGSHGTKSWKRKLLTVLALTTLGIAIGRTLLVGWHKEGMQDLLLISSQEYAEDIYIWSSVNLVNETAKLEPDYSEVLDLRAKLFGGIVIFRDGAFYLIIGFILDLVIIAGIVLYHYVRSFMKEVRDITPNVPRRNVMEWTRLQARREAAWHKYRMLRLVFDDSNEVYHPLLKLQHVGNLLMYCFIMVMIVFFKDASWIGTLLFSTYLIKAEIGYHIDGKIAEVNDAVRQWIRSWAWNTGKIQVGDEEIDAAMILDEIDKQPMGLGKGKFLIHQFFHLKFLGIVLSIFFSMADDIRNRVGA